MPEHTKISLIYIYIYMSGRIEGTSLTSNDVPEIIRKGNEN